ncbi:TetR family transcriptional regulator [Spirillospora sp. NPDC029432]|uniref:TetR/AcrR family transcriptional regulator n=1 Tax=Spirillospora sp. NPDC029432 TaxID=3154599 RepID=UPI0034528C30
MAGDEDLTARARIRDAALEQFAAHGVKGTTIRGVAEAAGVSPGLVQHHFGSKAGLRAACDEYAIEALVTNKKKALAGGMGDPGFLALAMRTGIPVQRYLARALVDGSPGAARFFDEAVAFSEEILAEPGSILNRPTTSDLRAYAAVLTTMSFGVLVLHEHLHRSLGADPLTMEGYPRLGRAMFDILTDDLLPAELVEQARAAMDRLPGDEGEPDS